MTPVQSSISLEDASSRTWDAIVIGAGCAGAVAARQIAIGGARRVLLVDKAHFPRYKVCGCCLGQPAQSVLASIGLKSILAMNGAVPTDSFYFGAGGAHTSIPLPNYVVLSRERLDAALVASAMDAGVSFLAGATAALESVNENVRVVRLKSGDSIASAVGAIVVIADGLGSRLLRTTDRFESQPAASSRIGAGAVIADASPFYRPGVIYMACGKGGYVGASRREDGHLAVAAAFDAAFVKSAGGLANAARAIHEQAHFPALPHEPQRWRGTPELTRFPSAVSAHRAFVVGDAAGYVEPFTGEGMTWAMHSAIALAPIALRAITRYDVGCERQWAAAYRRIVCDRTALCRALAAALRHPALVNVALRAVSIAPILAAPFVRHLNAPRQAQKEVAL